jgi:putative ABC transport system permease protein
MRQTLAVTAINLQSIPHRIGASLVICIGIAGVVAVLVTVLAMATGLRTTWTNTAREDRAIVLSSGTRTEAISFVSRESVWVIESAPGVRDTADGRPAVSPELLLPVNLTRTSDGKKATLIVRGLTRVAADVRPEIHLTSGRMYATGLREIIVGKAAFDQFAHLDVGDTARFYNGDWTIVGLFESRGDTHESQVLTDADTLMSAARRTAFSAVTVTLVSASAFDAFKDALLHDPRLKVDVERETEFYGRQAKQAGDITSIVATTIAAIMAVGALFGALNTMYSAVSARAVEIATLRALGFSATPVVISVLVEAQLLALVGGIAGGAIAWLLFNDSAFTTGGLTGQVEGRLHVDATLIAGGLVWAMAIGFLAGLFPALRATRMPVAEALRVG